MGDAAPGNPSGAEPRRGRSRPTAAVLTPPTGIPTLAQLGVSGTIPPLAPVAPRPVVEPCMCGHGRAAHDHYRPGWDCVMCGAATCGDYRPEGGGLRRLLRWVGLTG